MDLRHLRYFVAVAEELHFGRAAQRLRISQPPLSQQIKALEGELGVLLFQRTKREVRLTSAGGAFLERARQILAGMERAVELARRAARGEVGKLDVGYSPGIDFEVLPKVLRAFGRKNPGVEIRLLPSTTFEQIEALGQRRCDVGFLRMPARGEGVVIEPIHRERLFLAVPDGHPIGKSSRAPFKDLVRAPFVSVSREYAPVFYDLVLSAARAGGVSLRIAHEAPHFCDALSLVAAGLGVAVLPEGVTALSRPGVLYRPLTRPSATTDTALAYHPSALSPAARSFVMTVRSLYPYRPGA